jgi:hypothetical protein
MEWIVPTFGERVSSTLAALTGSMEVYFVLGASAPRDTPLILKTAIMMPEFGR